MRKTISLLMLFTSIAGSVCAQSNNASDRAFEVPDNIIMNRRFFVSLESGNKMQIEVSDISDLDRMQNIDSLLQVFLADILPLKDSLADPLTAKRIDYVTDAQNRKKIRFQQSFAKGASFLVNKGELSSLRTEQDTISLIGIIADPFKPKEKVSLTNPRYYHFTFYLNNIGELNGYINSGLLKEKIETIHNSVNTKWPLILGGSSHYLKNDKSISADKPKGFTANRTSDYLTGFITVNGGKLQTLFCAFLKHWAKVHFFKPRKNLQMGTRVLWEPHYLFAKDNQN